MWEEEGLKGAEMEPGAGNYILAGYHQTESFGQQVHRRIALGTKKNPPNGILPVV